MTGRWLAIVLVAVSLAVTGCANLQPESDPSAASASPSGSIDRTSTPTPAGSTPVALVPGGTAADNLPFFSSITAQVAASSDSASGRAYIDALVAAGFDKAAMQVTPDTTTIGNPAESVQFSVRWGEECLLGQVGPAIGAPVTTVAPVLADGACLIGDTRPIDW